MKKKTIPLTEALGTPKPFEEVYPFVESFVLKMVEHKSGHKTQPEKAFSLYPGERIPCGNTLCKNGGYSVGQFFRDTLSARLTDAEINEFCHGHEGPSKARLCCSNADFRLQVKYKAE